MQSQADGDVSAVPDGNGPKPLSVEDAVGNSFLQLLAEAHDQGQDQRDVSSNNEAIQAFARDVRRRKEEPPASYDGFVDLAASAAVRVLVYGPDCAAKNREDPAPLALYRRMLWLVKHAMSGTIPCSVTPQESAGEDHHGLMGDGELETTERQRLVDEAHDSGYSAGFAAGAEAEAFKRQRSSSGPEGTYAEGFAAGRRRLMNSEIKFAFARGQQVEQQRIRACLEEGGKQISQVMEIFEASLAAPIKSSEPARHPGPPSASTPDASAQQPSQYWSRGSDVGHASPPARLPEAAAAPDRSPSPLVYAHQTGPQMQTPASTSERASMPRRRIGQLSLFPEDGESRHAVATCVFCGVQLSQNSILRHKRRHHPAELAAVGVPLRSCSCWWPGCDQLQDNLVHNQLTTHLQRKHNFSPPGDPNAFTENIKYLKRMTIDLQISIIAEAAQQLNAVKLRIQDLESRLRRLQPCYVSRHGLPDVRQLHESRPPVLLALLESRERLPPTVQEVRQLTRARGMRSQLRSDEGTWWEVADDLEAGLDPSSKLARAVASLAPPGDGPTVHLNPNTLSGAPDMNDPSWTPQYVLPLQTGRDVTGLGGDPVGTRAGAGGAHRESSPGSLGPAIKREAEDDEEDGRYQELMAKISRRVLDDKPQSDWDHTSSDEGGGGESADAEDDTIAQDGHGQSDGRQATSCRKRSAATASSPRVSKHLRTD